LRQCRRESGYRSPAPHSFSDKTVRLVTLHLMRPYTVTSHSPVVVIMKRPIKTMLAALLISGTVAQAAVTVTIQQVGSSLVVNSTGTLNTAVCTGIGGPTVSSANGMDTGVNAGLAFGAVGSSQQQCLGTTITPNTDFGTGASLTGPTNAGVSYFFQPNLASGFWGPTGWTSATNLVATMTFAGATLASAGLTPGSYAYTLSNGGSSDTITLNILAASPASIPTLSEWGLIALVSVLGLSGVVGIRRHNRSR